MMRLYVPLAILIVLSGCDIGGGTQGVFLTADIAPFGDRSGLVLMDEGTTSVPMSIQISNPMREDALNVQLVASNVNNRIIDMSVMDDHTIDRLVGTRALEGAPGVAIRDLDIEVALQQREYSTRIDYHLCARTTTVYDGVLCVAPSGTRSYQGEGCVPQDVTVTGTQGGPVSVTAMRQLDAVNSVSIMFDLVNYGEGIVFDYEDECAYISQDRAGMITLEELRIGGTTIECSSTEAQPTRRMGFDQRYQRYTGVTFQCIIDKEKILGAADAPVARPVSATFSYGYHVKAGSQVVTVRSAPGHPYPTSPEQVSSTAYDYDILTEALT